MSDRDKELERIKRIREQQLRARDPTKKDRAFQQRVSARQASTGKLTLSSVIRDIPGKWLGTILGTLVGIVAAILVHLLVDLEARWVDWLSYFLVFAGIAMGRGLGAAMDWREEDHDALVKRK